jgi:hypothetical protein
MDGELEIGGQYIDKVKNIKFNGTDATPKLNPDRSPGFHIPINNCEKCKSSNVLSVQDMEGWFCVICLECNRESTIKSADMNSSIRHWNDENE